MKMGNILNSTECSLQVLISLLEMLFLVIKANLSPTSEMVKTSADKVIKNNYFGNYFVLSSEYKNFSAQYQFNIPTFSLNGAFLNTNENQSHIFIRYKHKNFTFSTGMYWTGMPSEYKTKSLSESLVDYRLHTQIMNNKSMFVLGISYDFSKGKKTEIQKKLNNDTAPAATFKEYLYIFNKGSRPILSGGFVH